ncbi:MAG: biopolymer transporter ExbD [candidate division WOR-3 bacterium]
MLLRKEERKGPSIPTASLGDIAFLLIIFFMVTSIFSREKGLKIVLPPKGEQVKLKSENILTVLVNPYGEVSISGEKITLRELRERVRSALDKNPELVVALKVSRNAPYKTMIDAFDELKAAKAERISLAPVKEGE